MRVEHDDSAADVRYLPEPIAVVVRCIARFVVGQGLDQYDIANG